MRILVSGGGTGGHIVPTLAVVDALVSQDSSVEMLYVGQTDSLEARLVRQAGIPFEAISAGKFRRSPHAGVLVNIANFGDQVRNVRDAGRVGRGFVQALGIVREFRPDVVFIKGGFVSLPVGWAARLLRIPYVVHESDVVPGLTNKLLAGSAVVIATGFPITHYTQWPSHKLVFTGSPVQSSLLSQHRLAGLQHFGFSGHKPVILVLGGSQGARSINSVMVESAGMLVKSHNVIHITGPKEYETVISQLEARGISREQYRAIPYLDNEIGLAYAAADLVVSRAGAQTIAELALLGKPAVIIPNEGVAAHQIANGRALSRAGAAEVLPDSKLTTDKLCAIISGIFGSTEHQATLSRNITAFAHPDAASELARLIVRVGAGERL